MRVVSVKAFGASLGACDVCMEGILFFADLVTRLLGISTTSRENWSFFPFFLACWLTVGSSISFSLLLKEILGTDVVVFSADEGVSIMLYGMLKEYVVIFDEYSKVSQS
jgi:hypothetical protein